MCGEISVLTQGTRTQQTPRGCLQRHLQGAITAGSILGHKHVFALQAAVNRGCWVQMDNQQTLEKDRRREWETNPRLRLCGYVVFCLLGFFIVVWLFGLFCLGFVVLAFSTNSYQQCPGRTAKKSLLLSLLRQSYINFSCSSLRKYRKYCRTMCLVHEQSLDKKGTSKSRSNSLPSIWRRTKDQARIFCKRCHCGIRNQQHAEVAPLPWWQPLDSAGRGRWPLSQEREWWTGAEAGGVSVDPLFHSNWNQSCCCPEELWRTDLKQSLAKEVSHLLLSVQRPAVPKPCSPVVHSKCIAHPLVFKQDIPPLNYI